MLKNFKSNNYYYLLEGDYALFTTPITKGGGEKYTYSIPTYQAIKGITEQIYWKPTFIIYIDEIKILNKISTEVKGVRFVYYDKTIISDRGKCTYLKDVKYAVKYHFEWNENRRDLIKDRNEKKHNEIMKRALKKGGRKDIFLGTRECVGFIENINESKYNTLEGYYKDQSISFGLMFHSFNYPTEVNTNNYNLLQSNFSEIKMENSIIKFIRPNECKITINLNNSEYKQIKKFKNVDDEYKEL